MTESLTLSLAAVLYALALRTVRAQAVLGGVGFCATALGYASLRDTNAVHALLLGTILLGARVLRRAPGRTTSASIALIAAALLNFGLAALAREDALRWERSLWNVFGMRVLTSPDALHHFVGRGMPYSDDIARQAGRPAFLFDRVAPVFEFRQWVRTNGRAEYGRWLLTHPGYAFSSIWSARSAVFFGTADSETMYCAPEGFRSGVLFPHAVSSLAYFAGSILLILGAAGGGAFQRRLSIRGPFTAIATMTLSALGLLLVAFHADAYEVARHCLPAIVLIKIGLALGALFGWDAVLARRGAPARSADRAPEKPERPFQVFGGVEDLAAVRAAMHDVERDVQAKLLVRPLEVRVTG